jgi:hypothetical protein
VRDRAPAAAPLAAWSRAPLAAAGAHQQAVRVPRPSPPHHTASDPARSTLLPLLLPCAPPSARGAARHRRAPRPNPRCTPARGGTPRTAAPRGAGAPCRWSRRAAPTPHRTRHPNSMPTCGRPAPRFRPQKGPRSGAALAARGPRATPGRPAWRGGAAGGRGGRREREGWLSWHAYESARAHNSNRPTRQRSHFSTQHFTRGGRAQLLGHELLLRGHPARTVNFPPQGPDPPGA